MFAMTRLLIAASLLVAAAQDVSKPLSRSKAGVFECVNEEGTGVKACFGNFLLDVDLTTHDPFKADTTCRQWCTTDPCLALGGNRTQECGACGPAAKCHPGASDWSKTKMEDADLQCMDHCEVNECDALIGDPGFECAACKEPYKCRPGAEHYSDYQERFIAIKEKHEL